MATAKKNAPAPKKSASKRKSNIKVEHEPVIKKTSSSGTPKMVKTSSMNKHKKRTFKVYRGQGGR